ncbi:MAG TPA: GAF domain-containing protein, partial [Anaerolineales bacterium]|nr:GAF domain-containing protein [Anaerolineales bacterium]
FAKRKLLGIRHSGARSTILYANRKGDDTEASRKEAALGPRESSISIPLKLRDEVIGSVDVRAAGNRRWDQDEMDIVNAIVERAAFALENARFLEESQKRAAKERVIGEIASKISAKNTAEELIKTAALELSRSLPGAKVTIQFKEGQESE